MYCITTYNSLSICVYVRSVFTTVLTLILSYRLCVRQGGGSTPRKSPWPQKSWKGTWKVGTFGYFWGLSVQQNLKIYWNIKDIKDKWSVRPPETPCNFFKLFDVEKCHFEPLLYHLVSTGGQKIKFLWLTYRTYYRFNICVDSYVFWHHESFPVTFSAVECA